MGTKLNIFEMRKTARDCIMPGLMSAGAKHDCDLLWAEIGILNAICHDRHFIQAIAYIEEFDPETGWLKEDKRETVSNRLADFKYIINSGMKAYMLPPLSKEQFEEVGKIADKKIHKPSILDITRMFG